MNHSSLLRNLMLRSTSEGRNMKKHDLEELRQAKAQNTGFVTLKELAAKRVALKKIKTSNITPKKIKRTNLLTYRLEHVTQNTNNLLEIIEIVTVRISVNRVPLEHQKAPHIACCYRAENLGKHKSFAFIKNSGS